MEAGGPPLWERFMAELRQEHLGNGLPPGSCVRVELEEAYQKVVAKKRATKPRASK
jgi:hypothetical protein